MAYALSKLVSNRLAEFLDLDISILFAVVSAKTIGTNGVVHGKKFSHVLKAASSTGGEVLHCIQRAARHRAQTLVADLHRPKALSLLYSILLDHSSAVPLLSNFPRSEERRVGKECL